MNTLRSTRMSRASTPQTQGESSLNSHTQPHALRNIRKPAALADVRPGSQPIFVAAPGPSAHHLPRIGPGRLVRFGCSCCQSWVPHLKPQLAVCKVVFLDTTQQAGGKLANELWRRDMHPLPPASPNDSADPREASIPAVGLAPRRVLWLGARVEYIERRRSRHEDERRVNKPRVGSHVNVMPAPSNF